MDAPELSPDEDPEFDSSSPSPSKNSSFPLILSQPNPTSSNGTIIRLNPKSHYKHEAPFNNFHSHSHDYHPEDWLPYQIYGQDYNNISLVEYLESDAHSSPILRKALNHLEHFEKRREFLQQQQQQSSNTPSLSGLPRIMTPLDLIHRSPRDIEQYTGMSNMELSVLTTSTFKKLLFERKQTTALELCQESQTNLLFFGDPVLDDLIRGLRPKILTEIAGEAASGKTQLCMHMLLQAQLPPESGGLGGKSLFISTEESIPMRRLEQLSEHFIKRNPEQAWTSPKDLLSNVLLKKVSSIDGLRTCLIAELPLLLRNDDTVKLLIIDSVASLFRFEYSREDSADRSKVLWSVASHLRQIACYYNIPVVVTNQVSDLFGGELLDGESRNSTHRHPLLNTTGSIRTIIPALGLSWSNCVNTRILLSRSSKRDLQGFQEGTGSPTVLRKMSVIFSAHLPSSSCTFVVLQEGIKGVKSLYQQQLQQEGEGTLVSQQEGEAEVAEAVQPEPQIISPAKKQKMMLAMAN